MDLNVNPNHAAMRCKTTVRHRRRLWWFVLVVDMCWKPRVTPFWWTVTRRISFGAQWYAEIKTGPPNVGIMHDFIFQQQGIVYGTHIRQTARA